MHSCDTSIIFVMLMVLQLFNVQGSCFHNTDEKQHHEMLEKETSDACTLSVPLPGVRPKNLSVSVDVQSRYIHIKASTSDNDQDPHKKHQDIDTTLQVDSMVKNLVDLVMAFRNNVLVLSVPKTTQHSHDTTTKPQEKPRRRHRGVRGRQQHVSNDQLGNQHRRLVQSSLCPDQAVAPRLGLDNNPTMDSEEFAYWWRML